MLQSCCNPILLLSPNWPSLVWPPLVWFPAVLSCRFLLVASVINSLVTRLHLTLQQTLDTSLPFHKWTLAESVECVTAAGCQDLNWGNWCFLIRLLWWSLFSACFRLSMCYSVLHRLCACLFPRMMFVIVQWVHLCTCPITVHEQILAGQKHQVVPSQPMKV